MWLISDIKFGGKSFSEVTLVSLYTFFTKHCFDQPKQKIYISLYAHSGYVRAAYRITFRADSKRYPV